MASGSACLPGADTIKVQHPSEIKGKPVWAPSTGTQPLGDAAAPLGDAAAPLGALGSPLTVRWTQLPLWKVSYCWSSMSTLHSYQPWSSERT